MSKKLSLLESIPLGVGSIIGSGVLFLPSLTYKVSKNDVMISWITVIILCIPGIFLFKDMLKDVNSKDGMAGFVRLGLGDILSNSINYIVLGTVIFGMPSAAIIASDYIVSAFKSLAEYKIIISSSLIAIAVFTNFFGLKASGKVSLIISLLIVTVSLFIIFLGSMNTEVNIHNIQPSFNINNIYRGTILSFWAFAGFENMTFLYDSFKNPKRDLLLSILISIIVCGAIYLGLVYTYAINTPYDTTNNIVGLIDLKSNFISNTIYQTLISFFALSAVIINLISWTGGVSKLLTDLFQDINFLNFNNYSDRKKMIFSLFSLLLIFIINILLLSIDKVFFENILEIVSMNFLIVYALGITSYFLYTRKKFNKLIAGLIIVFILMSLSTSGPNVLYPLFLISISAIVFAKFKIGKA